MAGQVARFQVARIQERYGPIPEISRNDYFEKLIQQGYQLTVHQTPHIDLCGGQGQSALRCEAHNLWSLDFAAEADWPTNEKARILLGALIKPSKVFKSIRRSYAEWRDAAGELGVDLPGWTWVRSHAPLLGVKDTIEQVREELENVQRGQALFRRLMENDFQSLPEDEATPLVRVLSKDEQTATDLPMPRFGAEPSP